MVNIRPKEVDPTHHLNYFDKTGLYCVCGFKADDLDELIIHYGNPVNKDVESEPIITKSVHISDHLSSLIAVANRKSKNPFRLRGF